MVADMGAEQPGHDCRAAAALVAVCRLPDECTVCQRVRPDRASCSLFLHHDSASLLP